MTGNTRFSGFGYMSIFFTINSFQLMPSLRMYCVAYPFNDVLFEFSGKVEGKL